MTRVFAKQIARASRTRARSHTIHSSVPYDCAASTFFIGRLPSRDKCVSSELKKRGEQLTQLAARVTARTA